MKTVIKPKHRPAPAGFTLVELLTVIVIIGILASLTVGAGIMVRNRVRQSLIQNDIKQLDMALQSYKNEYGEFPPDFWGVSLPANNVLGQAARARVVRHLRKAFPRISFTTSGSENQFAEFATAVNSTWGLDPSQFTPAQALVFWLGGLPDPSTGKPSGFHTDPANPFKTGSPRTQPLFDFDPERLINDPSRPQFHYGYAPARVAPVVPYVYFRAAKSTDTGKYEYAHYDSTASNHVLPSVDFGTESGVAVPYLKTAGNYPPTYASAETRRWPNPETYQILAAGLDGVYGASAAYRFTTDAQGFTDGDYDNLANFTEGRLEDEIE